jgi:hypothetical protein
MSETRAPAQASGPSLAQARGGRARVAAQLAAVNASRPATGAGPGARAVWLQDKAGVHDQIAASLRQIGDIPGAVEAEVLASRCRIDARDLTDVDRAGHADGGGLGADGPAPGPIRPRAAIPPPTAGDCRGLTSPAPGRDLDRGHGLDPARRDDVIQTCGAGLP